MPRNDYSVLIKAEGILLDPNSTAEQVKAAFAAVDAQGDPKQSAAIRRTMQHEANHRK